MPSAHAKPAKSEPAKPPRQAPRRPRIDGIISAIGRGEYDDKLGELRQAITDRNEARKEKVLEQVREIWGTEATVIDTPAEKSMAALARMTSGARPNPFKKVQETEVVEKTEQAESPETEAAESTERIESPGQTVETESTVVPESPGEIKSSSETVQVVRQPFEDDLDEESDVISHSPVIG